MSELKATPGPWLPDRSGPRILGIYGHSRGLRVNIINWLGIARPASEEGQANARLMLASRDLYDALQAVIDWADFAQEHPEEFNAHGVKNLMGPAFDKAEAALKLARGDQ